MNTKAIKSNANNNFGETFDDLFKTFFTTNDLMGHDFFTKSPISPKETKFPPHDVISVDENTYRIDLAVAGFDRDDIEVTVTDDALEISGEISSSDKMDSVSDYVHRGIAKRSFKNKFRLPPHAEIDNCQLTNGILSITIVKRIPEEKLPKKVKIK